MSDRPEFDAAVTSIHASYGHEMPRVATTIERLLRYPRLRELLEEAGRIQLRTMEPRFDAAPQPLYKFVEAPKTDHTFPNIEES